MANPLQDRNLDDIPEALWKQMNISKEDFAKIREQMIEREKRVPAVGTAAPDFEIERLSPKGERTGKTLRLSSLRGRPVGLIFGSYTWPPFRIQAGRLNEIYGKYGKQVEIYCVYIQEAHPTDGWQVLMNIDQKVLFAQPTTVDERAEVAEACVLSLDLAMPTLLDDMTNPVDTAYCALPERLYVLDREGVITYRSEPGPWGFDVDAFEGALQEQISD